MDDFLSLIITVKQIQSTRGLCKFMLAFCSFFCPSHTNNNNNQHNDLPFNVGLRNVILIICFFFLCVVESIILRMSLMFISDVIMQFSMRMKWLNWQSSSQGLLQPRQHVDGSDDEWGIFFSHVRKEAMKFRDSSKANLLLAISFWLIYLLAFTLSHGSLSITRKLKVHFDVSLF